MQLIRPNINTKGIRWLVLDIDGTLTDGNIYYSAQGEHLKHFNIHDSAGIMKWIFDLKKEVVIISGDESNATRTWAKHVGIPEDHLFFTLEKAKALDCFMNKFGFGPEETIIVGDDDLDLQMFNMGKYFVCPPNAHYSVLERADIITEKKSGHGAVRELIDFLMSNMSNN